MVLCGTCFGGMLQPHFKEIFLKALYKLFKFCYCHALNSFRYTCLHGYSGKNPTGPLKKLCDNGVYLMVAEEQKRLLISLTTFLGTFYMLQSIAECTFFADTV